MLGTYAECHILFIIMLSVVAPLSKCFGTSSPGTDFHPSPIFMRKGEWSTSTIVKVMSFTNMRLG
jgi:hypothetical protein